MLHPEVGDKLCCETSYQNEYSQFLLTESVARYDGTAERDPAD